MLGEGWSEPIGMSCGTHMHTQRATLWAAKTYSEFERIIGRGKKRMTGREKENGRKSRALMQKCEQVEVRKTEERGHVLFSLMSCLLFTPFSLLTHPHKISSLKACREYLWILQRLVLLDGWIWRVRHQMASRLILQSEVVKQHPSFSISAISKWTKGAKCMNVELKSTSKSKSTDAANSF